MPGYRDDAKLHGGPCATKSTELLQSSSQASGCAEAAEELGRLHVDSHRSTAKWCADCTWFTARAVAIDAGPAAEPRLPEFDGAKARESFSNKQV